MIERHKWKLCCEWLSYCLSVGWKKEQLDALEAIFWNHRGWETFKRSRANH
jgi:hypothetical protein